jgi:hypothetical protein
MNNPLLMLVLELIGAGMVLAALAMELTGQSVRRRGRAASLASPVLLLLGGALVAAGWLLPGTHTETPELAFNRLMEQAPTAAGTPAQPRFKHVRILVNGTPSDTAEATLSQQHAYASELASRLAAAVVSAGISEMADAQAVTTEPWPDAETQRHCQDQDLLITIRLPAVRLPERDDYALWREPSLEMRWCSSGTVQLYDFRVLERPGDNVPYEQAVRSRLLALLRTTPPA